MPQLNDETIKKILDARAACEAMLHELDNTNAASSSAAISATTNSGIQRSFIVLANLLSKSKLPLTKNIATLIATPYSLSDYQDLEKITALRKALALQMEILDPDVDMFQGITGEELARKSNAFKNKYNFELHYLPCLIAMVIGYETHSDYADSAMIKLDYRFNSDLSMCISYKGTDADFARKILEAFELFFNSRIPQQTTPNIEITTINISNAAIIELFKYADEDFSQAQDKNKTLIQKTKDSLVYKRLINKNELGKPTLRMAP